MSEVRLLPPMHRLVPSPAPDAVAVTVDDEVIVVDDTRGILHLLNGSAALVWQCLDGVSPLDEICSDLADAMGVPYAAVEADVVALVHRLLDDAVAVAPGYVRPPLADELGVCDCGHDHGDDVEVIELPGNP